MNVEATTVSPLASGADTIVVGVFEGADVAHDLPGGQLGALLTSGEAQRRFKRLAVTHAEDVRVILVGLGRREEFDGERARVAAGVAHRRAREMAAGTLCWEVPHHVSDDVVAGLVHGTLLHAYRFERYRPSEDSRRVQRLLVSAHHDVSEPSGWRRSWPAPRIALAILGTPRRMICHRRPWLPMPRRWPLVTACSTPCLARARFGRREWVRLRQSPRGPINQPG